MGRDNSEQGVHLMNTKASETLIHPPPKRWQSTLPGKRWQSPGSACEEQGGYRNNDTLFLGTESNQQGVALKNRDNLAPQPSVNTFVPKETGELVQCHISTAPKMRVHSFLQPSVI
jgi:hypothetical protein